MAPFDGGATAVGVLLRLGGVVRRPSG